MWICFWTLETDHMVHKFRRQSCKDFSYSIWWFRTISSHPFGEYTEVIIFVIVRCLSDVLNGGLKPPTAWTARPLEHTVVTLLRRLAENGKLGVVRQWNLLQKEDFQKLYMKSCPPSVELKSDLCLLVWPRSSSCFVGGLLLQDIRFRIWDVQMQT